MEIRNRPKLEPRHQFKTNTKFYLILILVFSILAIIGLLNHEMWRDELEAWLIANNSDSISELLSNIKYIGHPGLWYICLYFITRFTNNVGAMQVFHLLIAIGFVSLFLFYAPFTKLQKFLFCFGYYTFYEYTIISRNYGLGLLFLFAFCALYSYRDRSYLPLAIILFLLSHLNAYTLIIGFALALTLIIDAYFNPNLHRTLYSKRWSIITSFIIYFTGFITAIIQIVPPLDSDYHGDLIGINENKILYSTAEDMSSPFFYLSKFARSFASIWKAYVAIPNLSTWHFHNSNIFYMFTDGIANVSGNATIVGEFNVLNLLIYPLCIIIFLTVAIAFYRQPIILFFYTISNCALIGFFYFVRIPNNRHIGHLFIIFIVSLWLSTNYKQNLWLDKFKHKFFDWIVINKSLLLTLFLCLHLIGGVYAYSRDLVEPFSGSKAAVEYIKKNNYDRLKIAGSSHTKIAPFSALLNKEIYYLEREDFGTYTVWTGKKQKNHIDLTNKEILEQVARLIDNNNSEILLILNQKLEGSISLLNIQSLAQFESSIVKGETYYLYLVTKN